MEKITTNKITPFAKDSAKWYSELVLRADLISYGPIRGTMYFKPYGYKIWKNIEDFLNIEFIKNDVEEVKLPLLFPESFLEKEKEHISGFSPEVLKVTEAGDKKLTEKLIIRPTSEVLVADYLKKNLVSYNQLPIKLNQWVNILRWENNTRPFLRNTEFFWQEGHTIHGTAAEAHNFTLTLLDVYENFVSNKLLIPVLKGQKTKIETFAGADKTYTIETILKDGQALQSATSHFLGTGFAKAFDIKLRNANNELFFPFQTSWGISTRIIGALIMTHGDDRGLNLPSAVAPFKVVIVTIPNKKDNEQINKHAKDLYVKLSKDFPVKLDLSDKGFGYKMQEWEIKGVPLIIQIGKKELENNQYGIFIRSKLSKEMIDISDIDKKTIEELIAKHDQELWDKALKLRKDKIKTVDSLDAIREIVPQGFVCKAPWIEDSILEKQLKQELGITIRLLEKTDVSKKAINSSKESDILAYFARAY